MFRTYSRLNYRFLDILVIPRMRFRLLVRPCPHHTVVYSVCSQIDAVLTSCMIMHVPLLAALNLGNRLLFDNSIESIEAGAFKDLGSIIDM